MRIVALFFLLMTAALRADTSWQMITTNFKDTHVQFQMPGNPTETTLDTLHSWKVETNENSYWAVITQRQRGHLHITLANVATLMNYLFPDRGDGKTLLYALSNKDLHYVGKNSKGIYTFISMYFNNDCIVTLCTTSQNQEGPTHHQFISTFAFLE